MRHRYSYLDPDLIRRLLSEMGLRRLFNQLLLQSGGDVEEAMEWMRTLQERGYIDPDVDLEQFFARLMQENMIGQDAEGNVSLAARSTSRLSRASCPKALFRPPRTHARLPAPLAQAGRGSACASVACAHSLADRLRAFRAFGRAFAA